VIKFSRNLCLAFHGPPPEICRTRITPPPKIHVRITTALAMPFGQLIFGKVVARGQILRLKCIKF